MVGPRLSKCAGASPTSRRCMCLRGPASVAGVTKGRLLRVEVGSVLTEHVRIVPRTRMNLLGFGNAAIPHAVEAPPLNLRDDLSCAQGDDLTLDCYLKL